MKIKSKDNVYVFSDPHYGHKNIVRGLSKWSEENTRDFQTIEEMNDQIVSNINLIVQENDILFCLGDFTMDHPRLVKEFRSRIKCKNLHLIPGNHDYNIKTKKELQSLFSSVNTELTLKIEDTKETFVMYHYPIASYNGQRHNGTYHLHGHCHLKGEDRFVNIKSMDVGMCGSDLQVYSLAEIVEQINSKSVKPMIKKDHHQ